MFSELMAGTLLIIASAFAYVRWQRTVLYRTLGARIEDLCRAPVPSTAVWAWTPQAPKFADRIVWLNQFFPAEMLSKLTGELQQLAAERSFVPTHKKGGTVAYETLVARTPGIVSLYHDASFQEFVSGVVGQRVVPTPIQDQSSLSLLIYDRPGDHIGWHYDHNFYRGRHFTVLLSLVNEGRAHGNLSHATLMAKARGEEVTVRTPPNTLVLFEGARVVHKVTPILAGEKRVILSMTYCTDPRASLLQGIVRRVKDMAFFGLRSLWT